MRRLIVRSMRALLLGGLMLGLPLQEVSAQSTGTIRGEVTDAVTMRPLAGAQVQVVGTPRGAVANAQGAFTIPGVEPGTFTVRTQMIGYRAVEEEVTVAAGQTVTVNFSIRQSAVQLDELIVTGVAGETQRRSVGNTVSTINAERLTQLAPVSSMNEMMGARAPGLTVLASSGQVGTSSRIRIRGAGSLTAGQEPVIYVDGIRVQSGTVGGGSTVQSRDALDFINPNDVESIEVIKGPAAATLYGADAAGGVIQIITKQGRQSGGDVQWTASYEQGNIGWILDPPTNYFTCTQARINNAAGFPGCQGQAVGTLLSENPILDTPGAIRDGGHSTFDISARGGGEAYRFFLSFQDARSEGVYFNNFHDRRSGRANFTVIPSATTSFSVNMGYSRTHTQMPLANNASNSILRNGLRGQPGANSPWEPGWRGFPWYLANEFDQQEWVERTTIGVTGNWNPSDWFSNRITLGMDKGDRVNQTFYRIDETGRSPWGAVQGTGQVSRFLPVVHQWTVDYVGSLNRRLSEDYEGGLSFGLQLNRQQAESHTVTGSGLVANNLNLVSAAAITEAAQGRSEQTSLGVFVQGEVGWRDRLYGTVAVRMDDNSAFGNEFSYVTYPKAQLAYIISEEAFLQDVYWLDELKLRTAWGRAGNAPPPFAADRTYSPATTVIGDATVNQLRAASFGNPNLKAETGQELELGFDASLLEGRMGVEFTYYNQQTKDALIFVPNARSSGFEGSSRQNIGQISNTGLELLVTGTPVYRRNFEWEVLASFGTNNNELVSFGGALDEIRFGSFASVQRHREGYPLGGFWSVDVVRDAQGNPVINPNGSVTVDFDNETYEGPLLPTREIGFSNTFTFLGNLSLYTHLDYKGGNKQWCAICSVRSRLDQNHWEVNDPNAPPEQALVWTSLQTRTHIWDADFVKLREVSLSYRLPSDLVRAVRATGATLTVSGRNLALWTKYEPWGKADPEVVWDPTSEFGGLDYASTPMTRRLAVGMRFEF
ncbi:MAG: SusC/RagA family TonB-linked outer membrane protein [Gemmatimonadales bacterium]|nr:MAG: SusC/RagA family TonB-linked outer membrane protein [Gemmatimonadales bacterium]